MNPRAVAAEFVGTALLLAAIVGSGIMAQRLCGGNVGLELLANALATGGALVALILAFGPISGAHLNPAVTIADAWQGGLPWTNVGPYVVAQTLGALSGTALADGMFGLPLFFVSHHARSGAPMLVSEFVATFGLLVHALHVVRQPGGDHRALIHRHVRRHPARRRPGVRPGPTARRVHRHRPVRVPVARTADVGEVRRPAASGGTPCTRHRPRRCASVAPTTHRRRLGPRGAGPW